MNAIRRFFLSLISSDVGISQCGGDEEESQTLPIFSAQTPLSSRHSVAIPLGKKHQRATIDVIEGDSEGQLLAKLTLDNLPEAPSVAATFHLSR